MSVCAQTIIKKDKMRNLNFFKVEIGFIKNLSF